MPERFSQHGEDSIAWSLFRDRQGPGYFVEVGALDGVRFSNTFSFERAGWRGVCVEAHRDYIERLRQNRPRSLCVHAAVSSQNQDEVEFYANDRGSLSTLDRSYEPYFRKRFGDHFGGFKVQRVPMKTLTTILEEAGAPAPLDIVSIDVEGHEIEVLKGFNFEIYQPRVLVIEALNKQMGERINRYLTGEGYHRARKVRSNLFYCRDSKDVPIIANAPIDEVPARTRHPADPAGPSPGPGQPIRREGLDRISALLAHWLRRASTKGDWGWRRFRRRSTRRFQTYEVGFHGDTHLLKLVRFLAARVSAFIETGCNTGSTAKYMAEQYPRLKVYSCEADEQAYAIAAKRLAAIRQAKVFCETSPSFLYRLHEQVPELRQQRNLYWLDAHGYGFEWPLKEEIAYLTRVLDTAYVMIDDFRVPGRPEFAFEKSNNEVCAYDTIQPQLDSRHQYRIIYPTYSDGTSDHHPLTGSGVIVFGDDGLRLPVDLQNDFILKSVQSDHSPVDVPSS